MFVVRTFFLVLFLFLTPAQASDGVPLRLRHSCWGALLAPVSTLPFTLRFFGVELGNTPIGEGRFSRVWSGRHVSRTGKTTAVIVKQKKHASTFTSEYELLDHFNNEVQILNALDVTYDVFQLGGHAALILEVFPVSESEPDSPAPSLRALVKGEYAGKGFRARFLEGGFIREVRDSLLDELEHLHSTSIGTAHGDLNSGNVLLGERGGKGVAKIIDFGWAKELNAYSRIHDLLRLGHRVRDLYNVGGVRPSDRLRMVFRTNYPYQTVQEYRQILDAADGETDFESLFAALLEKFFLQGRSSQTIAEALLVDSDDLGLRRAVFGKLSPSLQSVLLKSGSAYSMLAN